MLPAAYRLLALATIIDRAELAMSLALRRPALCIDASADVAQGWADLIFPCDVPARACELLEMATGLRAEAQGRKMTVTR